MYGDEVNKIKQQRITPTLVSRDDAAIPTANLPGAS